MFLKKPIRRNQLISPWGIGSICNFPGDETLMVAGLDAWEEVFQQALDPNEFIVREERLARRLEVDHFKLPPDYRKAGTGVINSNLRIPFVRFPLWHYCPRCGDMENLSIYSNKPQKCKGTGYSTGMSCQPLKEWRRPRLIPSRFIAICPEGHIEDFPFMEWVHGGPAGQDCRLRLRAGRSASSLSGIQIECVTCGIKKSMAGAFRENSLSDIKSCGGQRPWLGEVDQHAGGCSQILTVVQRGGANVYFPQLRSSIYLPKWETSIKRRIIEVLDRNWDFLINPKKKGDLNKEVFKAFADKYNVEVDELLSAAEARLQAETASKYDDDGLDSEEFYRKAEYEAILKGEGGDNQDFYVTNIDREEYDHPVGKYFKSIALVHKLRETRALVGFTRLLPDNGKSIDGMKAELSTSDKINWLPAIVVKGEGIFFQFNSEMLNKWLRESAVQSRFSLLNNNVSSQRRINPRFILIHTFAHILINQFSYVCGYGSSALRERIYCDCDPPTPDNPMNGVLIYTASGDSEGSLGGLVRQGKPGYLEDIVESALFAAQWCSADPICIDSTGQGPDNCNLAACHNCSLLPETCCEERNRLLDRALLTGIPDNPEVGFFYGFDE